MLRLCPVLMTTSLPVLLPGRPGWTYTPLRYRDHRGARSNVRLCYPGGEHSTHIYSVFYGMPEHVLFSFWISGCIGGLLSRFHFLLRHLCRRPTTPKSLMAESLRSVVCWLVSFVAREGDFLIAVT